MQTSQRLERYRWKAECSSRGSGGWGRGQSSWKRHPGDPDGNALGTESTSASCMPSLPCPGVQHTASLPARLNPTLEGKRLPFWGLLILAHSESQHTYLLPTYELRKLKLKGTKQELKTHKLKLQRWECPISYTAVKGSHSSAPRSPPAPSPPPTHSRTWFLTVFTTYSPRSLTSLTSEEEARGPGTCTIQL